MIISVDDLKNRTQDYNDNPNDELYILASQNIVEDFLGYKLNEGSYNYTKTIDSDYLITPYYIDVINSITLNGKEIDYIYYDNNCIFFDSKLKGSITISYEGGMSIIPEIIKVVTIQIAAKLKSTDGLSNYVNNFNTPTGSNTFQPTQTTDKNYFSGYLVSLNKYRAIYA